jgi:AhpD family alkylhydroperoxidase
MTRRLDQTQVVPAGIKALGNVDGYAMQRGLSPILVDLAYLRISQTNKCACCPDMHTRDLLSNGLKVGKLALVQSGCGPHRGSRPG